MLNTQTVRAALAGAILFASSSASAQDPNEPIDIKKINSIFADIVKPIVESDEFLEAFVVEFGEGTDLDKDKVKLIGDATFAYSSWTQQSTKVGVDLEASVTRLTSGGAEALASGTFKVETDVLGFVKFAVGEYHAQECDGSTNVSSDEFGRALCEELGKVEAAQTFTDLLDIEARIGQLSISEANRRVTEAAKDLAEAAEGDKTGYRYRLDSARKDRDLLMGLNRRVTRTEGQVTSYSLAYTEPVEFFFGSELRTVSLKVNEKGLYVSLALASKDPSVEGYYKYRGEIVNELRRLQNASENDKEGLRSFVKGYLDLLRGVVTYKRDGGM